MKAFSAAACILFEFISVCICVYMQMCLYLGELTQGLLPCQGLERCGCTLFVYPCVHTCTCVATSMSSSWAYSVFSFLLVLFMDVCLYAYMCKYISRLMRPSVAFSIADVSLSLYMSFGHVPYLRSSVCVYVYVCKCISLLTN